MVKKILLMFCMVSGADFYAMNEQSCCSLIANQIAKMIENPCSAQVYKEILNDDYLFYAAMWEKYKNTQNTKLMAQASWKKNQFDKLYKVYSFDIARKTVEEGITNKYYLQDAEYEKWMNDKVMISPEVELACGQALLQRACSSKKKN